MNKSVHEVENILKVALAAKKEEMASIQKCNRPLIRLKKKFLSYKTEIARLALLWPVGP
jgi:hypothetical protein